MNKANAVSEWIKVQKNAGKKNFELAYILSCSKSSISNLKYKRHQSGDLTNKAFEIIKAMEKADWPTWETVREAEKEMTPKPSNDELSRAVRKVDEQGFRIVEINDKANKLLVQVNAQKGQIAELREQMERSFEPMDEWKLMVMETKQKFESLSDFFDEEMLSLYNRVTSLENRYKEQSKQPRTGIIRKFWRWLW